MFGFRWVGGLREIACSDCCSDLGVGGWVSGNPNIVRIFKICTHKWTVPYLNGKINKCFVINVYKIGTPISSIPILKLFSAKNLKLIPLSFYAFVLWLCALYPALGGPLVAGDSITSLRHLVENQSKMMER